MKRCRVYVDASYRDGEAGMAVTGHLGDHFKCMDARGSAQAELLAMQWAIDMARAYEVDYPLLFCTDCDSVLEKFSFPHDHQWSVVWVPRRENQHANGLARKAYRDLRTKA